MRGSLALLRVQAWGGPLGHWTRTLDTTTPLPCPKGKIFLLLEGSDLTGLEDSI